MLGEARFPGSMFSEKVPAPRDPALRRVSCEVVGSVGTVLISVSPAGVTARAVARAKPTCFLDLSGPSFLSFPRPIASTIHVQLLANEDIMARGALQ